MTHTAIKIDSERIKMRSYFERSATVGLFATLILCLTVLVPAKGKHGKGKDDAVKESTTAPAVVKVSMRNMQFSPNTLRVKKGTVVECTNDDVGPQRQQLGADGGLTTSCRIP